MAPVAPESFQSTSQTWSIDAGRVSGTIGGDRQYLGGIRFQTPDFTFQAEEASESYNDSRVEAIGSVSASGGGLDISAEIARVDRLTDDMQFSDAGLVLTNDELTARASAEQIRIAPDDRITLQELRFTTCPEDDEDWVFDARTLIIDEESGTATLRGATFRVGRIPVFKTPYFSLPIDDRRKSGFLTPVFAERDRTGFDLTLPYYLNLAPNFDLLLEPRLMQDRGTQIGSRFRYLVAASTGEFDLEHLQQDDVLNRSRYFAHYEHESLFGERWALTADINNVSDSAYFEDFGDNLGVISQTHLDRYIDLSYLAPRWSMVTRVQQYQSIDDLIDDADQPYERLPQLVFAGRWGDQLLGFESDIEAVRFDRTVGATGWRFDSTQELSLRFAGAGSYITPAVGYRHTRYRIDSQPGSAARTPSRNLPVASLDAGLRFERSVGQSSTWMQTIEPRLLYVRIPYEDQSDLPVFDTILPDFNLVQLFGKYEFTGPDRIADSNQLSFGLTTRLIETESGSERLSATLGQTRYRNPRRVMLPYETVIESTRSNYIAELGVGLSDKWNLDVGLQWNGETEDTVRSETRFEFRPEADRLFAIAYRQREALLEQGDISMIWPVTERWRLIGQYSYSLLEKKPLERLAGFEYEACCWRFRVTGRRYIVRSTGETDSTVSIQFELKGLTRGRASPEELLGRGILGARRN